jgi:hypothetical protein
MFLSRRRRNRVICPSLEPLEQRRLLAASAVYAPHSTVEGRTLEEWAAKWWKETFSIPIYASDGKTVINPQFDSGLNPGDLFNAPHALPSQDGEVTFLFGSFFGGTIDRTVTVPADKPIFVPIANDEWSNPDTAPPPAYNTFPGNYTPKQLAQFAIAESDTITGVGATLDGKAIPNMMSHREPSLKFELEESGPYSIHNVFFGDAPTGKFPAAADGYYIMLKPLSVGDHVLHFVGSAPDNSGTPPLLSAFTVDTTYHIKVVAPPPEHEHGDDNDCLHGTVSSDSAWAFSTSSKSLADEVCE